MSSLRVSVLLAVSCLSVTLGCTNSSTPGPVELPPKGSALPHLSASEFTQLLGSTSKPVIVEFSVPLGCYRCDEMRPQVEILAEKLAGKADVCVVNFQSERQLVSKLGISVCPTYVAFRDGQELFRVAHPTTGDFVLSRLEDFVKQP